MKFLPALLSGMILAGMVRAQPDKVQVPPVAEAEKQVVFTGPLLMREVQRRLPPMPLKMTGLIRTRRKGDDTDRKLVSELRFGDATPHAIYRLWDAFGDPITTVKVTWGGGLPVFEQWDAKGEPLPAPAALDEVADTGLSWSDLSLSFLWWENAEITGEGRVKTRPAYEVTIPAPDSRPDVKFVRLWVDKKALFIVKAELRDEQDKLIKRIEVDSIKEVREDLWMVKDILIRDKKNKLRMGIRFQEVEEIGAEDE